MKTCVEHFRKSDGRYTMVNFLPAIRLAHEVKEQMELLHQAPELRYATFDYDPAVPAVMRPTEPAFPARGRMAWANGHFIECYGVKVTRKERPSMARVCAEMNRRAVARLLSWGQHA